MTLAELRYLVAVAQERHFGRAAQLCCVSQPALSTAIKKLEEELGVTLFLRERSNISTTSVGEDVVAQARRVLESAAAIQAIAETGGNHLASPLSVGAICTAAPYLLPLCAAHLRETPGCLELRIEQAPVKVLRDRLRDGSLDVIIVTQPFVETDVVTQELFDEPLLALLPRNHPLAAKNALEPDDLNPGNLILLDNEHCLRGQVVNALVHLTDIDTIASASTPEMLRNMVAHGLGVAVIPLCAAQSLCSGPGNLVTRPFREPVPTRSLALAWRASFPRHRAIDVLRRAIQSSGIAHGFYTTSHELHTRGLLVDNSHW